MFLVRKYKLFETLTVHYIQNNSEKKFFGSGKSRGHFKLTMSLLFFDPCIIGFNEKLDVNEKLDWEAFHLSLGKYA